MLPDACFTKQRTPSVTSNTYTKSLGAKAVEEIEHTKSEEGSQRLTPAGASIYRALSAGLNYLAQDRPDLAYTANELCRDFSRPTIQSLERLKRAVRYIRGAPRLVYLVQYQSTARVLDSKCGHGLCWLQSHPPEYVRRGGYAGRTLSETLEIDPEHCCPEFGRG